MRRGSTRLEGVPGEFCQALCGYIHPARARAWLRENAVFPRVSRGPLRPAHKGQKRRPEAIVVVPPTSEPASLRERISRPRVVYAAAPHGGLEPSCRTPNICLSPPPPLLALPNNTLYAFRPAAIPTLFSFLLLFPRPISPRLGRSVYRSATEITNGAQNVRDAREMFTDGATMPMQLGAVPCGA